MKKITIYLLAILAILSAFPQCVTATEKTTSDPLLRLVLLGGQKDQIRPCG